MYPAGPALPPTSVRPVGFVPLPRSDQAQHPKALRGSRAYRPVRVAMAGCLQDGPGTVHRRLLPPPSGEMGTLPPFPIPGASRLATTPPCPASPSLSRGPQGAAPRVPCLHTCYVCVLHNPQLRCSWAEAIRARLGGHPPSSALALTQGPPLGVGSPGGEAGGPTDSRRARLRQPTSAAWPRGFVHASRPRRACAWARVHGRV